MSIKTYVRGVKKTYVRQPRNREHNFLKYWRVVSYYIRRKYNLTAMELDMMLYLYDMPYFNKEDFNFYGSSMSWDKRRFYDMIDKGMIKEWRPGGEKYGRAKLWELTHKGKSICSMVYKKLLMEEPISQEPRNNPIFKNSNYTDKIYKKIIQQMNRTKPDSDTE